MCGIWVRFRLSCLLVLSNEFITRKSENSLEAVFNRGGVGICLRDGFDEIGQRLVDGRKLFAWSARAVRDRLYRLSGIRLAEKSRVEFVVFIGRCIDFVRAFDASRRNFGRGTVYAAHFACRDAGGHRRLFFRREDFKIARRAVRLAAFFHSDSADHF